MRKILSFLIILSFSFKPLDCNQDIECVQNKLTSFQWIFQLSTPYNDFTLRAEFSQLVIRFNSLNEIQFIDYQNPPHNATNTKETVLYATKYKLVKKEYDQVYVRIYKMVDFFGLIGDMSPGNGKGLSLKDSIDFQFLYNEQKKELNLRNNALIKGQVSSENVFVGKKL